MLRKLLVLPIFLMTWLVSPAVTIVQAGGEKPQTIKDNLTNTDGFDKVRDQSYCKIHKVKLVEGKEYTIDMTAQFDTYLRLENAKGTQLASNDDFNGFNSRIVFTPKKGGVYHIVATTFGQQVTGPYTLVIRQTNAAGGKVFVDIKGKLTNDDPFDTVRAGCHHKVHKVKLTAGTTYTIHCTTVTHDGYLRLEDATGKQLDRNDDFNSTRASRIVFTPKATGTYRIIVTTFSGGRTGSYHLTVAK